MTASYGPYSYSRMSTYQQCPRKFKYAYIDRLPKVRPPHPAAERGTDLHKSVEDFLNRESDDVHIEIQGYLPFFHQLRELGAVPELPFAVTRDWIPCDYDSPDAYLRGFIDAFLGDLEIPTGYDWKTGKIYPDHSFQANLYATVKMVEYETDRVDTMMVYFDQKPSYKRNPKTFEYPQAMWPTYRAMWDAEVASIENDEEFMCNPTWKCAFCDYSKLEWGGPCPF